MRNVIDSVAAILTLAVAGGASALFAWLRS
jgi:hypothetical protein